MPRIWKARSAVPGERNFVAGTLENLALAAFYKLDAVRGDGVLGTYDPGGGGTPPTTPVITLTPASGAITVTIDGDAGVTNYVYYRGPETLWTSGGSRVGDGDIALASLTQYYPYDVCVWSDDGTLVSEPALATTTTTGTAATDIEQALYWKLTNTVAITTLCSTRIYPINAPPTATSPYIVYDKISGGREFIMGGKSGVARPIFQISSWASTYAAAKALGTQVRLALDGTTATTWSGFSIMAIDLQDDGETWESFEDDSGKQWFCVRQDFEIWHAESIS